MRNIKILQVAKYFPPDWGGIETVTFEIAEGLSKYEIESDVLCFGKKGKAYEDISKSYKLFREKTNISLLSQPFSFDYINTYRKIRKSYDVIHIHMPNFIALLIAVLFSTKSKVVIHWHSDLIKQKLFLLIYDFFVRLLSKKADVVLAPTENHILCSRYSKIFKKKYEIIPYCINEDNLSPSYEVIQMTNQIQEKYHNRKIIFSIGRLVYYKGFDNLIKLAKILNDDFAILIGGEGPLFNTLKSCIHKNKLDNKVILLGNLSSDEMKAYYSASRYFCFPSVNKAEMFGMVQLEAMYYGKPIISTDIPGSGAPLVSIDGETGFIGPINDPKFIKDSIMKLENDTVLYDNFSWNCKKRFNEHFETKIVIDKYYNFYQSLVK